MATDKQIAANRANAKRSSGPKTAAGKKRSSRNAYRHGLSASKPQDESSFAMLNAIANALVAEQSTDARPLVAKEFALAQVELARIQAIRAELWAGIVLSEGLNCDTNKLKRLSSLDRYERYELTRRRRASKKMLLGG